MSAFEFTPQVQVLEKRATEICASVFRSIEQTAQANTARVLSAFYRHRVSENLFAGTTGYGLGDRGRDTLDAIFAELFGGESNDTAALVRTGFVNGTHAITAALYGILSPGQTLLYVSGTPYDTIHSAIGIAGSQHGSLRHYGIDYAQVDFTTDGELDFDAIRCAVQNPKAGCAAIQRSRGYAVRKSLSIDEIAEICRVIRAANPTIPIFADNCYGEFVEGREPLMAGVDIIAGSLIKNPGGGLAPCGGYIAGRKSFVDAAANRMTAPGIGGEYGATLGLNRLLYQGLFLAPHTVAEALKTAVFAAAIFAELGYQTDPAFDAPRTDIIQMIRFGNPDELQCFCRGIQQGAPVDAFVTPEAGDMPGYADPVIMAAGAFIQGASIELSADAPLRKPYCAYLQGGLTYESGKLGVLSAVQYLLSRD